MTDMQKKLEQYRQSQRRKEKYQQIKGRIKAFLMLGTRSKDEYSNVIVVDDESLSEDKNQVNKVSRFISRDAEDTIFFTDEEEEVEQMISTAADIRTDQEKENKLFRYTLWTVYFLFWCTLYIIAIELKFGIVFLMFSTLFGIYFNTRTGPKKRNEVSAYSVFNKNCTSIDGTLKAEQFEREIRYGAGSVR